MKELTWKLVLPLTVFSFALLTKWWLVYALPVDAPDIIMVGFPLTYAGDGWHTSMSLQIFFFELVVDLLTYFIFWWTLIMIVDRFLVKIKIHIIVAFILLSVAGYISWISIRRGAMPENLYYFKRPFEIEVLTSGYKFYWDGNPRPDNFDYKEYERKKKEIGK